MRKTSNILLFLILLAALCATAKAEDRSSTEYLLEQAQIPNVAMLFDMDLEAAQTCPANASVTMATDAGIGSLYLIFDRPYGTILLTDGDGKEAQVQTGGLLHAFIDVEAALGEAPGSLTVTFADGEAELAEMRVFTPGQVPGWVQKWEQLPDGEADLFLLSAHGDDEQLFFAGLLPWYGAGEGYRVQVAYFTDHRNITPHRVHEMLNGLWNVGIRYYPVFGAFPDYYTFDVEDAREFYETEGSTEEDMLSFVVEQLRRYRPKVAVSHDIAGEYGHGMHKLCAELLQKAVEVSGDTAYFPALAEQYGTWDVPKTYLHLWPENEIVMNWDIPMEAFDGKTAFEVSRDLGFASHISQQKDFAWYFRNADTAADVKKYSPCHYGLYRTTVGEDVLKNDLFENIPTQPPMEQPEEPEELPTLEVRSASAPQTEIRDTSADRLWLLIPASGALVLAVMTLFVSEPRPKEKN